MIRKIAIGIGLGALLGMSGVAYAQVANGGVNNLLIKLSGSTIVPANSNWTFGATSVGAAGASSTLQYNSNGKLAGAPTIITDGTNLGVGTSSPAGDISIGGSAGGTNPLFLISSSTAGFATSTALEIDSNGNVGIATGSPSTNFSVVGNGYFTGNLGINTVSNPGVGLTITQTANGSGNGIIINNTTSTGNARLWVDTSNVARLSAASAEGNKISINGGGTGFVGIGTTTQNWNLEVAGTRPSVAISDFSDGANLRHWLISSMAGFLYFSSSTDAYATSSYPNLTLSNTTGRVGIDTAQPNAILEAAGTGANSDFRVSRVNNQTTYFGVSAPGGSNTASNFYINGTNIMTLSSSGNVGIATGTPAAVLDIGGTGAVTDFHISRQSGSANYFDISAPHGAPTYSGLGVNNNEVLDFPTANVKLVGVGSTSPWGALSVNPSGLGSNVPEFVVGSSTTTHLIVTGGGKIGIGSTTPAAATVITTAASTTPNLILDDTANGGCLIMKDSAGGTYTELYTQSGLLLAKATTDISQCN